MFRFVADLSPLTDSMPGPPISDGTAIGAIRSPPGVIGSNLKSPCRGRLYMRLSVRVLGPYRKFVTTVKATLAGQQETGLRPARWAQASSRFQDSRRDRSEEHTSELQSPCNLV